MTKFKLLALDMDGTVLNSDSEISTTNQLWMKKAMDAGLLICFSTGRGINSIRPYIEQLQWTSPIVAVNGGEVWSDPNTLLSRQTIDAQNIIRMRELATEYDVWHWAYSVNDLHNAENWHEIEKKTASMEWLKFGFFVEDDRARQEIEQTIVDWGFAEITNSSPQNLEINPVGVTKAAGLRQVCELVNIHMNEIIAMGDSLNDFAMIKEVGLGVAMGNAQEQLKEVADVVTVTNDEDGVAKIIQKYIIDQ